MAAPEIDIRTSLQTATVGVPFVFQPAAFGEPTTWTALHLPTGLVIDDETGEISGTPTTAGFWQVVVRATNLDGSDQIVVLMPVLPAPDDAEIGEWSDLPVDFDVVARTLAVGGVVASEDLPLFRIARGDKINVLVGIWKFGRMWDVNPEGETVGLKLALKEFEPEILLTLAGGTPEKVVLGEQVRYRIPVWLDPAAWAVLSDYEADRGTELPAPAEFELTVGSLYDVTVLIDDLTLVGGMGGAGYGSPADLEETLVFEGLVAEAGANYELTVSLVVPPRAGQNVQIVQTMRITKVGGVWTVTEREGDDTAEGSADGDHWRAILAIIAVAGDADSVDVDLSVTTTAGIATWTIYLGLDWIGLTIGKRMRLYGAGEVELGDGYEFETSYGSEAEMSAAFAAAWLDLTGEAVTVFVGDDYVVITSAGDTYAVELVWEDISWGGPGPGATPIEPVKLSAAASITGRLAQVASAAEQPLRFSAQAPVAVMRDLVPDQA